MVQQRRLCLSCGHRTTSRRLSSGGSRSTIRRVTATMVGLCYCESSFNTRELGMVMKAKPMGMLWMLPAGWSDHLPAVPSRMLESLLGHCALVKRQPDRSGAAEFGVELPSGGRTCGTEAGGTHGFERGRRVGGGRSALVIGEVGRLRAWRKRESQRTGTTRRS